MTDTVSATQAARIAKRTVSNILRAISRGTLPAVIGPPHKIKRADLRRWMRLGRSNRRIRDSAE